MKVYIITSGSYSDYCVHGIMDSKEKAEKYVNDHNKFCFYDDYDFEEFELNSLDPIEDVEFFYIPHTNTVLDHSSYHTEFGPAAQLPYRGYESKQYKTKLATGVSYYSFQEIKEELKNTYFCRNMHHYMNKAGEEFQDGVYKVTVHYNEDFEVMKKTVYDKIAAYKEYVKEF